MPISVSGLSSLFQQNIDANMKALGERGPLAQPNPKYFIEFCTAIATGLAAGTPIQFTSKDGPGYKGSPAITGTITGTGIIVPTDYLHEHLYTSLRSVAGSLGMSTLHEPWPLTSDAKTGKYLDAFAKGFTDGIVTHFVTCWNFNGTDPLMYQGVGVVEKGNFSGLISSAISGAMVAAAPNMKGAAWPNFTQAFADTYVDAIQNNSTSNPLTITGTCVSAPPGQICSISLTTSTGSGVAT